MKKVLFTCIIIITMIMGCASQSPTPVKTDPVVSAVDDLDPAIREASDYLNTRIPQGRKAVFLNITSDYPDLSEYILSLLSENAVNDGIFSVVDRIQLDAIRAEMNFQLSGEVDDNSAQEIGKMLGAQTIVSGAVNKIGSLYRMQVKAIEVQTAGVQGQWSKTVSGSGTIIAALTEKFSPAATNSSASVATTTVRLESSSGETTQIANPAAPVVPPASSITYKIGDIGPAGGFIFYDKGNKSSGWRYLEAAPAETEFKALFGSLGYINTGTELGSGRANTQLIKVELERIGEITRAAHRCTQININSFNDWFLPSKSELAWMYLNLKEKGLGDFNNDWYWSSSIQNSWHAGGVWYRQKFSDGTEETGQGNITTCSVRAIRAF